jgi:hypothetical protein
VLIHVYLISRMRSLPTTFFSLFRPGDQDFLDTPAGKVLRTIAVTSTRTPARDIIH